MKEHVCKPVLKTGIMHNGKNIPAETTKMILILLLFLPLCKDNEKAPVRIYLSENSII